MTARLIEYRSAAVEDILQVHGHLNTESSLELADRFLVAIEHTVEQIRRFPHAGSLFPGRSVRVLNIRRWPVSEFPRYYVYYTADDRKVTFLRLIHSARDLHRQPGL